MVASANVGFPIHLATLYARYGKESSYEPQLFPGLIFRFCNYNIVFLIFLSGRIVITGAKQKKQIKQAFDRIVPILLMCKDKALGSSYGMREQLLIPKNTMSLKTLVNDPMFEDLLEEGLFDNIE